MLHLHSTFLLSSALYLSHSVVATFTFQSTQNPSSCDPLNVNWTGGKPPFQLLITPVFGNPINRSIPSTAFSGDKGTFSTPLTLAPGKKFVLTMSDSGGFASGGTTTVFQTGASQGGKCDTTEQHVDFNFELNKALQQCRPYEFSNFGQAVPPVTILGLIPGGQSSVFMTNQTDVYEWTANVQQGTSMIFVLTDSVGHQGGSSDLVTVGASDDNTCINSSSPSSTAAPAPSSTSGTTVGGSPSPSGNPGADGSKSSAAAISGAVVGLLILVGAIIALVIFFVKKKSRRNAGGFGILSPPNRHNSLRLASDLDLSQSAPASLPAAVLLTRSEEQTPRTVPYALSNYDAVPFTEPPPPRPNVRDSHYVNGDRTESGTIEGMSATQRKAATAGVSQFKPARYILHTDIEESEPPNEEELVELPPQYSESRTPMGNLQPQGTTHASLSQYSSYSQTSASPSHQLRR